MTGNKRIFFWVKLAASGVLLFFIYSKINLHEYLSYLQQVQVGWFLTGILLFILSKYLTAIRLQRYLVQAQVPIPPVVNLRLYLLGMFYNLFLPGGIGGDAYKGYWVKKHFSAATKWIIQALLLDRISGLFAIGMWIGFLLLWTQDHVWRLSVLQVRVIGLTMLIFSIALNYSTLRFLFPQFIASWLWALLLSLLSQCCQLMTFVLLMLSLGLHQHFLAYQVIFLASSMVAVLPFTIGGLGARELTFMYGAVLFGLDASAAVTLSTLFFIITLLISLTGVWYHFQPIKMNFAK